MSRIRYRVATSLDGYIAGPKGEYDWIEREVSPAAIARIRAQARKDIGLFGGGLQLPRSPASRAKLRLTGHRVYRSGIALLEYAVTTNAS